MGIAFEIGDDVMLPLSKTWLATGLTAAIILLSLIFLLSGCSQPSKPAGGDGTTAKASEPSNPSEPVTAKTALLPMYSSAYKWAHDVVLLRLTVECLRRIRPRSKGNVR